MLPAIMEGYLLKDTNLRIKADPSFFCPFSLSLMLEPVTLVVGNSVLTVERASLEDWFEKVGKTVCPFTGKRLTSWVVIKPNNALRERIKKWAMQQNLDLGALEAAALKVRRLKQTHSRRLPRANSEADLSAQSLSGRCLTVSDTSGWAVIDVTKPVSQSWELPARPVPAQPVMGSKRVSLMRSFSMPTCIRA